MQKNTEYTEKIEDTGNKESVLEKCAECGEYSVVSNGRCKYCLECGSSVCSV